MPDVEGHTAGAAAAPHYNPYANDGVPPPLPPYVDKLKRFIYMTISAVALRHFRFFRVLLKSPHIRHEWFQIGIALTIAMVFLKAYVELYQGRMLGKQVSYANFRHTTHAFMVLILVATVTYHAALWPHYGWNTPIVLGLFFLGMVVQFLLIVPTYVQNIVALIGLTFFLQEYSGMSNVILS